MFVDGCLLVHGFPPDSVSTYLFQFSRTQLPKIFKKMEYDLCMVGHTHELLLISCTEGRVSKARLSEGVQTLAAESKYIVNVGSVGQPRDGNNNAKYVIWESKTRTLEVRFVPYDIRKTSEKIIAIGLPKAHADRLW